jgi:hypothetical protein
MPYQVIAQLNDRNPVLQIRDVASNRVCLRWEYQKQPQSARGHNEAAVAPDDDGDDPLHDLFRQLFLLTTEQYLRGELTDGDLSTGLTDS